MKAKRARNVLPRGKNSRVTSKAKQTTIQNGSALTGRCLAQASKPSDSFELLVRSFYHQSRTVLCGVIKDVWIGPTFIHSFIDEFRFSTESARLDSPRQNVRKNRFGFAAGPLNGLNRRLGSSKETGCND